jgi:CheY-like chemotaxis protein
MLNPAVRYLELEKASERGLHILMVEDNPINRRIMTLVLERLPAKLTAAVNGLEAVRLFEEQRFDVVLMDLQMPGIDGYEATRRIRAFEAASGRARTPIIVVSAHTRAPDIAESKLAGADHHLGKPIDVPTLLATMDSLMTQAVAA